VPASRPSAVTIGAYDGVHSGHRQVIDRVRSLAEDEGLRSVVVTFDRHPASVVRPESAPKLLTDLDQKLELLRSTGVDEVVVIHFDEERASEPAEDFVDQVLAASLASRVVVVGRDFHFGKGRRGNVALLGAMGADLGFRVVPFDLVADSHDQVISSTRIRTLIAAGDLVQARALLGRPHEVRGRVVEATAPGSDGTPGEIDITVPGEILLPPPGDYSVLVGPEAGGDVQLRRGQAVIPDLGGEIRLFGVKAPPHAGARQRVLFSDPD